MSAGLSALGAPASEPAFVPAVPRARWWELAHHSDESVRVAAYSGLYRLAIATNDFDVIDGLLDATEPGALHAASAAAEVLHAVDARPRIDAHFASLGRRDAVALLHVLDSLGDR